MYIHNIYYMYIYIYILQYIYIYIYIYGCFSFVLLLGHLAATAQKRLATETARNYQIMCFLMASWFIHHLEGLQTGSIFSYKCFDRNPEITRKKTLTSQGKGNKKPAFACETTSQNYEKNVEFSWFSHQNRWFYLGKLMFLKFWRPLGTMDDHIHFEQPRKSLKNIEFLSFFFGSPVCGQQSRVRK